MVRRCASTTGTGQCAGRQPWSRACPYLFVDSFTRRAPRRGLPSNRRLRRDWIRSSGHPALSQPPHPQTGLAQDPRPLHRRGNSGTGSAQSLSPSPTAPSLSPSLGAGRCGHPTSSPARSDPQIHRAPIRNPTRSLDKSGEIHPNHPGHVNRPCLEHLITVCSSGSCLLSPASFDWGTGLGGLTSYGWVSSLACRLDAGHLPCRIAASRATAI